MPFNFPIIFFSTYINKLILMKKLISILALFIFGATVSVATAAEPNGHQQYKITSYNFGDNAFLGAENQGSKANTFDPLLITGSRSDILNRSPFIVNEFGTSDTQSTTSGFAVSADYDATSKISLHGAIGVTKNDWDASSNPNYNSSWEANLGVIYKLFNNLSYEVHFGYMDTGDLFKQSSTYNSVESIIMVSNQLTMSF